MTKPYQVTCRRIIPLFNCYVLQYLWIMHSARRGIDDFSMKSHPLTISWEASIYAAWISFGTWCCGSHAGLKGYMWEFGIWLCKYEEKHMGKTAPLTLVVVALYIPTSGNCNFKKEKSKEKSALITRFSVLILSFPSEVERLVVGWRQ